MAIDITKWSDLVQVTKDLKKPEVQDKFKVLVIDTVDIFHKYATKQICQREGVQALGDIAHGKGYAMVDDLEFDMIKSWENLGYRLFFISHAKEKTEKLISGGEILKYIPSVERRCLSIVSKFVDNILFGYVGMDTENGGEKRVLYTRETLSYQAGSRFANLPSEIPFDAKKFNDIWKKSIDEEMSINPDGFTSKKKEIVMERQVDFAETMEEVKRLINDKFLPSNNMGIVVEIGEKHLGQGRRISECSPNQADLLEIILCSLEEKVEELSL